MPFYEYTRWVPTPQNHEIMFSMFGTPGNTAPTRRLLAQFYAII